MPGETLYESLRNLVERQSKGNTNEDDGGGGEDSDGYVLVAKESIWPSMFGQYFMDIDMFDNDQVEHTTSQQEDDDMLFYVQQKPNDGELEVKVFRKTSKNLPGLGDPHINWEESVYLNLIMHDLEYFITCAVCMRLQNDDLKVICKKTLKVHASHHMRRMDSKGETSDQSYPNIFFIIDSFDEVFEPLSVQEGEIVCVELAAKFKGDNTPYAVIFLGSVKHESLLGVYDAKTTLGTKMAQKMSWMTGSVEHYEYIRMRGPHGKGYAEMRIGQIKNHMIEHSKVNRYRQSQKKKDEMQCSCHFADREKIYAPTTTHADNCPRCGKSNTDNDQSTVWGSTVKWFQQKKSAPTLSPQLTYVTLPWSRIMRDILEVRQKPVFSKDLRR